MDKGNVNVRVTKGQLIVDYYAVLLTIRVLSCLYIVSTTTRPCCSVLSVCALGKLIYSTTLSRVKVVVVEVVYINKPQTNMRLIACLYMVKCIYVYHQGFHI